MKVKNNKTKFSDFIVSLSDNKRIIKRTTGYYHEGGVKLIRSVSEKVSSRSIVLSAESAPFFFHIDKIEKNLFLYIVFFNMDENTCLARIDDQSKLNFLDYCQTFSTTYEIGTINKALKKLVKANVLLNIQRFTYMVNPLVATSSDETRRRNLIRQYSKLLIEKGKHGDKDFYPTFHKK